MGKIAIQNFTLEGNKLKAGQQAPDFTLVNINCEPVTLSNYGNKIKILSCFPSIDTPICEAQTRMFAKKYATNQNVIVLNISADLPFAFNRWCDNHATNIEALSDYRTHQFALDYGILMNPYKLLYRSVFVLDPNNKVALALYNDELSNPVDFELVEQTINKLLGIN